MDILNIISGPVIGAVIGYFTNYIAVKMLFRPHNPVKTGKYTLPFTPGIIPKRKNELGKAVGHAVGNNLLTTEDLQKIFTTEDIKNTVVDKITSSIFNDNNTDLKTALLKLISEEKYADSKKQLTDIICTKIADELNKLNVGTLIAEIGANSIKEKVQGSMLALMVNDSLIASFAEPMGAKINDYVSENGFDTVRPVISREIDALENMQLSSLLEAAGVDNTVLKNTVSKAYDSIIDKHLADIISKFNIAAIVEEKICAMEVAELEKLVLSVMKNELDAIVNLGAVIGFLIGILNIFL